MTVNDNSEMAVDQWLAIRKEEALKIDPSTAEVDWSYALILDPYGVYPATSRGIPCVGRAYFARRPGSDVWVEFGDLPEETRDALWERHKSKLAFPAGLFIAAREGTDPPLVARALCLERTAQPRSSWLVRADGKVREAATVRLYDVRSL